MSQTTPLQQILRKLKSVFPEAVTETEQKDDEGKPCYTYALKQEFIDQLQGSGLDIANDQNRYELQFPGKQTAKAAVLTPCHKTLIAERDQSKNFDDTGNVFIEGDNLDALRMLQKSYRGKVKVIYIDPPYNTGNDDFVYNDDFNVKQKEYLQAAGVLDEDGARQISETQTRLKGRFHAGWLAFMYPRLELARELLSNDGVIFISIDDNEQANLKLICDEVFGEENLCGVIKRRAARKTAHLSADMSDMCDYVLVYSKDILRVPLSVDITQDSTRPVFNEGNSLTERIIRKGTKAKCFDGTYRKGIYKVRSMEFELRGDLEIEYGEVKNETTIKAPFRVNQNLLDKTVYITRNFGLRRYLLDKEKGIPKPMTDLFDDNEAYNEKGAEGLFSLFQIKNTFKNSKPVYLPKILVKSCTNADDDSIVLDFFAGSATTAHAVMQLNAEDGGNRKFILVQLPEMINPKKSKEAHEFCTNELNRPPTIAEIAKERIRRAGAQLATESPATDIDAGFRTFVIQDSLLSNSEQQPLTQTKQDEMTRYLTELKPENFDPILYEALLKTGAPLHLPIVTGKINGYPFAICDRRCYCVTKNLSQKIVQAITDKHAKAFDILYYLSDTLNATTSYTEIETVIHQTPGDKQVQMLAFY